MITFFGRKRNPEKLWFTTDIHSHLLPGIDDGSHSAEESVTLVRRMQSWGIRRMLLTPHVTRDTFENTPRTIDAAKAVLDRALEEAGIVTDMGVSAEYRLDDLFTSQLKAGMVRPLPNDYLLVENSFLQEPPGLDSIIFDLQLKGLRPVMAHPERFRYYWDNPGRLEQLHAAGALFQINLLSLAGAYGKEQRRMAVALAEAGLVDFLGSDLHHLSGAEAITAYLSGRNYDHDRRKLERYVRNDRAFV